MADSFLDSCKFNMRSRIHSSVTNDLHNDPEFQIIRRNRSVLKTDTKNDDFCVKSNDNFDDQLRIHNSATNDLNNDHDYQVIRRNRDSLLLISNISVRSSNDYFDDHYNKLKNQLTLQSSTINQDALELTRKDLVRAESFRALKSYRKNSFTGW